MNKYKKIVEFWIDQADAPVILDGNIAVTGSQAAAGALATIELLKERGVVKGDIVAMTGGNAITAIPIYVGIELYGAVASGLATFASAEARKNMVRETKPKLIFVDRETRHMGDEVLSEEWAPPVVEHEEFVDLTQSADANLLLPYADALHEDDYQCCRYTSGSTGLPKPMMIKQRGDWRLSAKFISYLGDLGPNPRFLATMPLGSLEGVGFAATYMAAGLISCIFRGRATPAGILAELERYHINFVFLPSSQVTAIVREPAFEMTDLSALKTIIYAGQSISAKDLHEAIDALGGERLVQVYGQTEVGMLSALDQHDHCSNDDEILTSAGTLFFPEDIELRDDAGNVVGEGEVGEIFVKGDYVQTMHWQPDGSLKSPVGEDGWVGTTDCARRVGDRIWITGRKRDMVLYRGYNVPTKPIEESLARFPGVLDAVVHPVADDYAGEVVFAWVRPEPGVEVDTQALCEQVVRECSKWSRPTYVQFIDEIPLKSALRKFDKVGLRDRAEKLLAEGKVLPVPQG